MTASVFVGDSDCFVVLMRQVHVELCALVFFSFLLFLFQIFFHIFILSKKNCSA